MGAAAVYILVRDDPYTLEELFGILRRQSYQNFKLIGILPKNLSHASMRLVEKNLDEKHTLENDDAGALLNRVISSRPEKVTVILDSAFLPSNQVWLDRLLKRVSPGDEQIVAGRIAHDLYTNWLIQNDFTLEQNLTHRHDLSPFYFQFGNFAVVSETVQKNPFPSGGMDDFALRWILLKPGEVRFVADAVITSLNEISVKDFVAAYKRFGKETGGFGRPLRESFKLFFRGVYRDSTFAWKRKMPQWIFFSIYMRLRQAIGFYKTS